MNEHLLINTLHDKFQSACKTGFSAKTTLIKIIDNILYAIDNKSFTAFIIIDMSAAIDTADHITLLNRLNALELIIQHFLGLDHIYLIEIIEYL